MRKTIPTIKSQKNGDKIVMLTAYTAPFASILDKHCDMLLVGDSLGMVLYGMDSTLSVPVSMMINHGKAVVKASSEALIVVDMPFGSYQESKEKAFKNAAKIIAQTGCQAVKIEGGIEMAETIAYLVERAIPVMGHIGLKPQHVHQMGGYKVQGKDAETAKLISDDAKAVEAAGCFAVVLEGVKKEVAETITTNISIPTIGIGASPECDGQVLVAEDMLGLNNNPPKFVTKYAELADDIEKSVAEFAKDVRDKKFPLDKNCY